MWQNVYNYAKQLFKLKEQTDKNTTDLKEIQQTIHNIIAVIQRQGFAIERQQEKEADEREKLVLRLENLLLRSGYQS